MDAVDFLHLENPPTCTGVEPATLGAEALEEGEKSLQERTLPCSPPQTITTVGDDGEDGLIVEKLLETAPATNTIGFSESRKEKRLL
ncbi:hypothetical protein TNCV_2295141 [Trichonephila clavipes]|nr:hypothetical protein TNCV_2295141 [Trichonephila clavipes]